MPVPTFALARSTLRPWRLSDLASLLRHADDPEVSRATSDRFPSPYTRAAGEAWLAHATGAGAETDWAVTIDGAAVGGIGVVPGERERRVKVEIGYWLGRAFWGQGVITEAVTHLTDHLLVRPGLLRVEALVYSSNPASARVLEKAGYRLESVQKQAAIKRGEVLDVLVYVRLAA